MTTKKTATKKVVKKKPKVIEAELVETKTTEVAQRQELAPVQQSSPEALIAQAIEKGTSVETMEKLLAMRRELKAEFAKEQFDISMSNFQMNCPIIEKKKAGAKTKSGQVAYYYAPLESIVGQVKSIISNNGLSYQIKTETTDKNVKVSCIVKHKAGHSEDSSVEIPLGIKTGVMSSSQVVAAALTFAKRYAFCNAFGILTGDEDNDSKVSSQPDYQQQTPAQVTAERQEVIKLKKIISESGVESLKDMKGKLAKSKKYSPAEKKGIIEMIDERLKDIPF